MSYSKIPIPLGELQVNLTEMMHYLYLPVKMAGMNEPGCVRLPENVKQVGPLLDIALRYCANELKRDYEKDYYYLSARKGFATQDNPLNRPGWHCDGYGTEDANFVYWLGHGTRFTLQEFKDISFDHVKSLKQYADQVEWEEAYTPPARTLYYISPLCVHTTPAIPKQGAMRQYIKISVSTEKYNLEDNSHNYLFDYKWEMHSRSTIRNDPNRAQRDYVSVP